MFTCICSSFKLVNTSSTGTQLDCLVFDKIEEVFKKLKLFWKRNASLKAINNRVDSTQNN